MKHSFEVFEKDSSRDPLRAKAAVFDVDYTLINRSSTIAFARVAIRHRLLHPLRLLNSASLHLKVKWGMAKPSMIPRELDYLKGFHKEILNTLGEEVFLRHLIRSISADTVARIREHQARGTVVFLASASLDFLLRPLSAFLKIPYSHVLSTSLEYSGEICTGRFDGRPCYGLEKLHQTAALLKDRNIALADTAFYTDSFMDLPMLRRVGYPVAVNPDPALRIQAIRENWPILRFR